MVAIDIDDTTQKRGSLGALSRVTGGQNPQSLKRGVITLGATADDGDTTTIDIFKRFGMSRFEGIKGFIQTTADSVIAAEAPTTVVDRNNLTITVGGSTDNKKRTYVIYGV